MLDDAPAEASTTTTTVASTYATAAIRSRWLSHRGMRCHHHNAFGSVHNTTASCGEGDCVNRCSSVQLRIATSYLLLWRCEYMYHREKISCWMKWRR